MASLTQGAPSGGCGCDKVKIQLVYRAKMQPMTTELEIECAKCTAEQSVSGSIERMILVFVIFSIELVVIVRIALVVLVFAMVIVQVVVLVFVVISMQLVVVLFVIESAFGLSRQFVKQSVCKVAVLG